MCVRQDGAVEVFVFNPGSLGSSKVPTWLFRNFTAAEGVAGALAFLNEIPRQGAGEACATSRSDGSVGLFYLEPVVGTQQTWHFRNFTAAEGATGVLAFLNEPPRQGPGQVSAVIREDGSVGLFYLEPGSLGWGTEQARYFRHFTR